ncbi:transposase [Streptomyces vinaceus]
MGGAGTAVADGCQGGATTRPGSAPADRRRRRRRRFRVRTGVPWRNIPVEYGPWHRIHDLFCRWQRNGACQRILTRLKSSADAYPFRRTSACPASDRAGHASAPAACGPTRRTPPAETAPTCARGIRCTIPDKADQARNRQKLGFRRRPTAVIRPWLTTASTTRSSTGSTDSSDTAPSPRGTTSSPSATRDCEQPPEPGRHAGDSGAVSWPDRHPAPVFKASRCGGRHGRGRPMRGP